MPSKRSNQRRRPTRREFAQMLDVSEQAIGFAKARGSVVVERSGRIDPAHPINAAYIAAHKSRVAAKANGGHSNGDARLAERGASLQSREFECAILAENTIARGDLAALLCDEAAEWEAVMRRAPAELGGDIADLVGLLAGPVVAQFESAMSRFLRGLGDQRAAVHAALDQAAHHWARVPLSRLPAPPLPDFVPPATLHHANQRYAERRAERVGMIMKLRAGELLILREAVYAAEGLRVGWVQAGQEQFVGSYGAELLAAAGIKADHGQMHALAMIMMEWAACAFVPIWPARELLHPGSKALTSAYAAFIKLRPPDAPKLAETAWARGSRMPPLLVPEGMEDVIPQLRSRLATAIAAETNPITREVLERLACDIAGWQREKVPPDRDR